MASKQAVENPSQGCCLKCNISCKPPHVFFIFCCVAPVVASHINIFCHVYCGYYKYCHDDDIYVEKCSAPTFFHARIWQIDIKAYTFLIVDVTAAIIEKNGKILIAKRKEGKWEFPGGKVEEGENMEECLKRELKEELGIDVKVKKKFCVVEHEYDFGKIRLHVFIAECNEEPVAKEHLAIKWVSMEELQKYDFMDADKKVIDILKTKSEK